MTVDRAGTVSFLEPVSTVALDNAGVAVALAGTGDVDEIADLEGVSLDNVADVELSSVLQVELTQVLLGLTPALFRWPISGLLSLRSAMSSKPS